MAEASAAAAEPARSRGRLYWFRHHAKRRLQAYFRAHKVGFTVALIVALILLFTMRAMLHPAVIWLRSHVYLLTLGVPLLLALYFLLRNRGPRVKLAAAVLVMLLVTAIAIFRLSPHNYVALYLAYQSLQIKELDALPVTEFDRIQPQNSIYSLANEAMVETESPAAPDYVRIGNALRWTIAIEPSYFIRRLTQGVQELFSIPGESPSPVFSKENRVRVNFESGENLFLWHNTRFNVIRAFGPWRFLNYEPSEVKYITDDHGEWQQIVTLIRWKGWFFPRPEFGGIQVIRQNPNPTVAGAVKRSLVGLGEWIPVAEIQKHAHLRGQNLVPHRVSRYVANSFRYKAGFFAPFPGYHLGDIRIPDMPGDQNDQPFTIFFRFAPQVAPAMLYHYFALEPFHHAKQGLSMSIFIPSDGSRTVYTYSHQKKNEALTGVSAIPPKVMESRKQYDWSRNKPVENRPYIKQIGGATRFFWLTTVVTMKDEAGSFIAGSIPDVVLTDATYKTPVWVNPLKPEEWPQQLEKELGDVWKGNAPPISD